MATNGHYRPFQIARPSADHVRLEVVSEGLDRLAEMTDPLAIVGVVGAFHSGKSFLLNALLWSLQQRTARTSVNSDAHSDTHEQRPSANQFAVADQVSPKTMGLWLLETDVRLRDGSRVVLLDSEGFFAHNVDESYDAKVFTIAALASSTLIFNAVSVIDQAAVEHLEILARRAQLFQIKNAFRSSDSNSNTDNRKFLVEFPNLIVAVEDFVQSLGSLTADQWLEQFVTGHRDKSNAAAVDAASIHDVFPKGVSCKTLFLPATDLADLQHLNIDSSPLTKRFVEDVHGLRDMVLAKTGAVASPANAELGVHDGRATAALLQFLLAHINRDTFPTVPSLWSAWLTDLQRHSETEVKQFVAERLARFLDGAQPPRSQAEFDAHAAQTIAEAEAYLKSMLFGIESVYAAALEQLRATAGEQRRQLAARNAQAIANFVTQLAKELSTSAERHTLRAPLNPQLIDAERERTLAELGQQFAAQTGKYDDATMIETQRKLLAYSVAQTFASFAQSNERRLAAMLDGALAKCGEAFLLTQTTGLAKLPKKVSEATEPLLTGAQVEHLAAACDAACDAAAAEHCVTDGALNITVHAAWLSNMNVYVTHAAASAARKGKMRQALSTSNSQSVCRYATKHSSKYAEDARVAADQIFPFPDEEEIVAGKLAPILQEANQRFAAQLAPLREFACVSENHALKSALASIHEDKLRYNLDAVKAASHSALEKCAKPLVSALNCGVFCVASMSSWTFESRAASIAMACFEQDVVARKFTVNLRRKVVERWLHTDLAAVYVDIAWRQRAITVTCTNRTSILQMNLCTNGVL
jgi:hypothetical protein